jgi:hypothetical protein
MHEKKRAKGELVCGCYSSMNQNTDASTVKEKLKGP